MATLLAKASGDERAAQLLNGEPGKATVLSRSALLRAAHDIKGQAPTFNYPLIARVAGSLSRLIDDIRRHLDCFIGKFEE